MRKGACIFAKKIHAVTTKGKLFNCVTSILYQIFLILSIISEDFSCGVKHILTQKKARRRRLSVSPSLYSFDHIPFIIIYIHSDQSVFIFCRGSIHISSNHRFRRIFSGSYMLFCEEKILFRLFSPIYIRNIPLQHRPTVPHRNRYTF